MSDLRNVLVGLNGSNVDNAETASINSETEELTLNLGEHIACVWYDDTLNKNHWYLGVVDQVDDTGLYVSFMK